MEFHIAINPTLTDVAAIEEAVRTADPAALVDIDGATLRVATSLPAPQLIGVIKEAGCPVDSAQVTQLPSICCGGCSG